MGDILSTVGAILSTMEDTQYCGGNHDACGGYHKYHGGVQYHGGQIFSYLSTSVVLNTPMVLMISPTCSMISSHGTQYTKDGIPPQY